MNAPLAAADLIAARAVRALACELDTWPKPGLVSGRDAGSHADMDGATFARAIAAFGPFFRAFAAAGDAPFETLRAIGIAAERAMLHATGGVNTHRGAIFGLGLLAAAAGHPDAGAGVPLGAIVAARWGRAILAAPRDMASHGSRVARLHGVEGARGEAACGFPSVYAIGLPALRAARRAGADPNAARVEACFALIAGIADTNLLHRGGAAGAADAKRLARAFLAAGGVRRAGWEAAAAAVHARFVAAGLSPGGAADLLAMTLFVDRSAP